MATTGFLVANEQAGMEYRDVWTASYVNDLPDSAFLYVEPGGTKDADGKTTPRSLRHFPVKDASGKPDAAHIVNALARIPQASSIPAAARMKAMSMAKDMAGAHADIGSGPMMGYEGDAGSGRSVAAPAGLEVRAWDVVVHLRADGDGRTLIGRAVPYGPTVPIPGGGTERFLPGAFARQIGAGPDVLQRVKLYDSHQSRMDGQQPIGRTALLLERADGLHGEWPLYNTSRASDALELVRSGEVTGLSIGFRAQASRRAGDGTMERQTAHLDHVVLTHEPVYADAAVTAVRSQATTAARPLSAYRTDLLRAQGLLARVTARL
jgi:HK97 family phage prohead protease